MRQTGIMIFLFGVFLFLAWFSWGVQQASAAAGHEPANQAAATQSPASEETGSEQAGTSPLVGVLVLVAPAAWMVWKSRRLKQAPKINATCCLPVIDEDRRPAR